MGYNKIYCDYEHRNSRKEMSHGMKKVSIDEALRLLGELKATPAMETVPITAAEGRVLAEDITAVLSVPPFDRSPYDGYAFMGEDTAKASKNDPVVLKVVEELPAGKIGRAHV